MGNMRIEPSDFIQISDSMVEFKNYSVTGSEGEK